MLDNHKVTVLVGPFEFMLAVTCAIAGPILLTGVVPLSINAELPVWAQPLWAIEVFLSGLFIFLGMWLRKRALERAGLVMQAGASAVYGVAIWINLGLGGLLAALFFILVLCGGSLLRLLAMREADRTRQRILWRGR